MGIWRISQMIPCTKSICMLTLRIYLYSLAHRIHAKDIPSRFRHSESYPFLFFWLLRTHCCGYSQGCWSSRKNYGNSFWRNLFSLKRKASFFRCDRLVGCPDWCLDNLIYALLLLWEAFRHQNSDFFRRFHR